MKKYGTKILIGIVIVAALTVAWYMSGSAPSPEKKETKPAVTQKTEKTEKINTENEEPKQEEVAEKETIKEDAVTPAETEENIEVDNIVVPQDNGTTQVPTQTETNSNTLTEQNFPPPVEPENMTITNKEQRCTLSISCATAAASNMLKAEKKDLLTNGGTIFPETEVVFYEGESVFNVLLRETKKNKIHFEFVKTPVYNSAYVEGIANIYEFDCGELSGWLYRVNGEFPNYGCSRYALKAGDKIEFVYTCDLGKDVAGYALESGWQKDE